MNRIAFLLAAALSTILTGRCAFAADAPALVKPGKVISAPDLTAPLGPEWSVAKGKWEPAGGVLKATDLPEEHHAAVLHLKTGPVPLVFECEFRFDTAKIFYIGCDAARHVGRLIVTPGGAKLAEDSTEVKGKSQSHTLAEAKTALKTDEWHRVRVEFTGDQLAARIDASDLRAQHPYLATPKARWWLAVGGGTAQIRNLRVSEAAPK